MGRVEYVNGSTGSVEVEVRLLPSWDPFPGQTALIRQPWNSETKPAVLAANFYTPNDAFYVRNHAPVPMIQDSELPDYEITFARGNVEG